MRWRAMILVVLCAYLSLGGSFTCTTNVADTTTQPAP